MISRWYQGIFFIIVCIASSLFASSTNLIHLTTPAIERRLYLSDTQTVTSELVNRFTGEVLTLTGDEFAVQLFVGGWENSSFDPNPKYFTIRDFTIQNIQPFQSGDTSGYRIELNNPQRFPVVVRYYTRKGHPEIYKDVQITNQSGYPILIDFIEVERGAVSSPATHQGFGQPVYIRNFYLGVAYPTAYNMLNSGTLSLKRIVGKPLQHGESYRSHPAIAGAAPKGRVQETFLNYIERIKAQPTRPFLLYNSWYDIRRLTDENCAQTIQEFDQYMLKPYGLRLDAFVLDDGWDNFQSCWDINREQFPQEFSLVQQKLSKIHSHLGLWASPWGGYGKRRQIRVNWAKQHGLETSGDFLCIAATNYYKCFKEKLLRYQREFGVKFFKLDGLLTRCNATNHGHLPGLYSQEQAVEHFIQLMKAMRQQDPTVFIDVTVGTWLSPWWLQYADCVWMTGADYAYTQSLPLFSERDKAITYRDQVLHDNFLVSHYQFPFSGLMTHGIIKGRLNYLGGKNETLRDFTNNAVIYFSRGVMMWELYITPSILSREEWDNLAQTIRWAYANQKVLKHTRFVLGNPAAGEIYGYLHSSPKRLLVTLRNPDIFPQKIALPVDQWIPEQWRDAQLLVKIVYPYRLNHLLQGSTSHPFALTLEGNEIVVLEILPAALETDPLPLDTRYAIQVEGNRRDVVVYASGGDSTVKVWRPKKSGIRLLTSHSRKRKAASHFTIQTQKSAPPRVSLGEPHLTITADGAHLQTIVDATASFKNGRILALCEFPQPVDTVIATATINGASAPLQIRRDGDGKWWWIAVPLHELVPVDIHIQRPGSSVEGTLSAILDVTVTETEWVRYRITAPHVGKQNTELPAFTGEHRVTVPILRRAALSLQPQQ